MSLSVKDCLSAPDFPYQLENLQNLLNNSHANLTFWGTRVVEVTEADGSISSFTLDKIARAVLNAADERCDADDLNLPERLAGIELVRKVQKFYEDTDALRDTSNILTWIIVLIREFNFGYPYTTRFFIEDDACKLFLAYSKPKFIEEFGDHFDEFDNHPASTGGFGPPLRVCVKEELIRA